MPSEELSTTMTSKGASVSCARRESRHFPIVSRALYDAITTETAGATGYDSPDDREATSDRAAPSMSSIPSCSVRAARPI